MKILLILIAILIFNHVDAQDKITKKNGEDVNAKVIEIGTKEVKFKKSDNIDGPLYTIPVEDLIKIEFANGQKEIFKATSNELKPIETKRIESENNIENVLATQQVYFYGYDFSHFQLSDNKRIGQDIKKYIIKLNGMLQEHIPEKKLKKWLKKDLITYNFNPTMNLNKKIRNEDIVSAYKNNLAKDSIQFMIDRYITTEKSGIAYVVIFECFDNASKSVSAYSVFFDIASKNIILLDYVSVHDRNSFNKIADWNPVAISSVRQLTKKYIDLLPIEK